MVKEPACPCRRITRRQFNAWVRKSPWRRKWQPTLIFLPEKSQGQRNLLGYKRREKKEQKEKGDRSYDSVHTVTDRT